MAQGKVGYKVSPMSKPKIYDYYVLVHKPDHPAVVGGGYVPEHILIAEQELGRYLYPDEVVKHKNGDTHDNSPENLEVLSNSQGYKKVINLGEEETETKKVVASKTFIACKFQKPCWQNVRAPLAKAHKIYIPYICSYQELGDIYSCSRYWGYLEEELREKENEDIANTEI